MRIAGVAIVLLAGLATVTVTSAFTGQVRFRAPFSPSGRRHFGAERRRMLLRHHDLQRRSFLLLQLSRPSQLHRTSRSFIEPTERAVVLQKQQSAKDQAVGAWESIQQWAASSGQTLPPPTLWQRAQSIVQRKPLVQVQVPYCIPPRPDAPSDLAVGCDPCEAGKQPV